MSQKKLYIHIGTEKTGTTSLQYFLSENEKNLNAFHFSYFGKANTPYADGKTNAPLVASCFDACPYFISPAKYLPAALVLNALQKALSQSKHDAILSSEFFSSEWRNIQHIRQLQAATQGRDVRIICYIRPQDEMLLSTYSSRIKSGHLAPLCSDEAHSDSFYFNYSTMLALWASVFGADKLMVRNYQRHQLVGGDICTDFLHTIGIQDTSNFIFAEDKNISLDARQVETLRYINHYLPSYGTSTRAAFDKAQLLRYHMQNHLPQGAPLQHMLSSEERKTILARFAGANNEVERLYMTPGALSGWAANMGDSLPFNPPKEANMEDLCQVIIAQTEAIIFLSKKNIFLIFAEEILNHPTVFVCKMAKRALAIVRRP